MALGRKKSGGRKEPLFGLAASLSERGHDVLEWPDWTRLAGSVCSVIHDVRHGVLTGAGDPRRASYAVGW